jgi:uncharacterized membrane protein
VNVTPPIDQAKGIYHITLQATVTNAKSTTTSTIDLVVVITFAVDISAFTSERQKDVYPGDPMYFNFTVKNKGSGDDVYSLKVDDSIFTDKKMAKWATFNKNAVAVKYQGQASAMMIITVPLDAEKKDYLFRVKAISSYDDTAYTTYDFTLSVLGISAVTLTTDTDIPKGNPSDQVTYTVKVKNTGTSADTYTISAENAYKSWVTLSQKSMSISYDTTVNLLVTIKIPDDALFGSYNLTVKAVSGNDDTIFTTIKLQVNVRQVVDFTVTTDDASKSSDPGKNMTYTLTIENQGNWNDVYKFEVTSSDSKKADWVTFEAQTLDVAYNDKGTIRVYVSIPSNYKDATAGDFDLTVKVISKINDSIYKQIKLTTTLNQIYELVLSCSDCSQTLDVNGNDAEWDVDVQNSGNGDDQVTFQIDQKEASWQKSWWDFSPSTLDVESGKTRTTTVRLVASRVVDVDANTYNFRVVATSGDGDTKSLSLKLEVVVVKAQIQITSWTIGSSSMKAGDKIPVTINLKNIGTAATPSTFSVALLLDNNPVATTSTSKMNANEEQTISLSWEPTDATSGALKVRVTVAGEKTDSSPKQVSVAAKAGLGFDLNNSMNLLVLVLIVVIVLIVLVMLFTRRRPVPAPVAPTPPTEEGAGEEEEEQGGEEEGGEEEGGEEEAPPEEEEETQAPTPRVAKIRCPKCKEIMEISSPKRPLEVRCSSCNAKLLLKK